MNNPNDGLYKEDIDDCPGWDSYGHRRDSDRKRESQSMPPEKGKKHIALFWSHFTLASFFLLTLLTKQLMWPSIWERERLCVAQLQGSTAKTSFCYMQFLSHLAYMAEEC